MLVTLPEETPVNEAADTAFHLEDRAGVQLAPIVVNGMWPHVDLPRDVGRVATAAGVDLGLADIDLLDRAARFRRQRQQLQEEQVARLADVLPLPQLRLPFLFTTELGPRDVDTLATALGEQMAGVRP